MRVSRWRHGLGPPLVIAAAAALLAGQPAGPPELPEPGPAGDPARLVAAATADLPACPANGRSAPSTGLSGAAWYRLDPLLDQAGGLAGQRLEAGLLGGPAGLRLDLDAESFAAGPSGGRLVVGTDDGRRSLVRLVDVAAACADLAHDGPGLIRRAVLSPDGRSLVEFRLDRRQRADGGIWRRPLDGGPPSRLAEPLPSNERLGLIFSTELAWGADGLLVVASCGESACLTRIVDPASGEVVTVDDPHVGEPIGLGDRRLVAWAGCPALPCPIVARDLATGRTTTIARLAGLATVRSDAAGRTLLVFEDHAARRIAVVDLDGRPVTTLARPATSARLVASGGRAQAGVELPAGWFALGRDGRAGGRRADDATFVRIADGRRVPATEVSR